MKKTSKSIKKESDHESGPGRFTRREFMATTSAGTAALFSPIKVKSSSMISPSSPNERLTAAVIGVGGRGRNMALWQVPPVADLVAICDVNRLRSGPILEEFYRDTGRRLDVYDDYRRVLDRQDIDVIFNATPQHWHTKINVDACRAGKDVYAEKPLTLTIDEGKILRRVIEETGRIVQVGTQQRSHPQFRIAISLIRSGRIGRLKQVAVITPGGIGHGEQCTEKPIPPELDWDFWSGQAPLNPYCEARFRRSGSWWDYGGGQVTGMGSHHMDIASWGIGEESGPLSVEAEGYAPNLGKAGYPDQFMPFAARMEYPGDIEVWFMSARPDPEEHEAFREVIDRVYAKVPDHIRSYKLINQYGGVLFIGDKGSIFVDRQCAVQEGVPEMDMTPPVIESEFGRFQSIIHYHTYDFLTCVRTRQQPISHATGQTRSQLPCHLVNIALRLGRKLNWDARREEFIGDSEANSYLKRSQREPYSIEG